MYHSPDNQDPFIDIFRPFAQRMHASVSVKRFRLSGIEVRRVVFVESLHGSGCLCEHHPVIGSEL